MYFSSHNFIVICKWDDITFSTLSFTSKINLLNSFVLYPPHHWLTHITIEWENVRRGFQNKESALKFAIEIRIETWYIKLMLKHLFSSISVPSFSIEALVGETVYLPCNISTQEINDDIELILWYREDKGTPIYRWVVMKSLFAL